MKLPAARMMFALKLPAMPLSAVITIMSAGASSPPSGQASSGCTVGSTRVATLVSTRRAISANGRALRIASCARRSLDAATIFMAFVICCVDLTARIATTNINQRWH